MKKLCYIILPFLLLAFTLNSCTKENIDNPSDTLSESTNLGLAKASNYRRLYKITVDDGETSITSYICYGTGGNCLNTVDVIGVATAYNEFLHAVENGMVSTYFSTDDYKVLFPDLADFPDVIADLIDGDSKIAKFQNDDPNKDDLMYVVYPTSSGADSSNYDRYYQVAIPVNE